MGVGATLDEERESWKYWKEIAGDFTENQHVLPGEVRMDLFLDFLQETTKSETAVKIWEEFGAKILGKKPLTRMMNKSLDRGMDPKLLENIFGIAADEKQHLLGRARWNCWLPVA